MANEKENTKAASDIEARFKALEEQNAKLMAALEAKWEAQAPAAGITRDEFLIGIKEAMKGATQATEVLASKMKPENADHLHRSAFEHPGGGIQHPKPALKREIVWGRPLPLTELTYAEVLALNALSDSLSRSQRRLARDGKWIAKVSDDDQRITISVPVKTIDDRQDLPAFIHIVQELTTGERAQDAGELAQELALLKAQVAQLQQSHA